MPLRSEKETKLFLSSFSESKVPYLKFYNLAHPTVLYDLLSPIVLLSISPKNNNVSVKLRPSNGASVSYIKGYGKNLLFETQHASTCFLVTIPWAPLGSSQLPLFSSIWFGWD